MDWDSSGSTTVTIGILRQVLEKEELGVLIVGGKGKMMLRVPDELPRVLDRLGLSDKRIEELVTASRISAKVDSSLLQDGYKLYHHAVIVSEDGLWGVIQQGMNIEERLARRYHWLSSKVEDYVVEPHYGIASNHKGNALNLIAREAEGSRKTILDLAREKPEKTSRLIAEASRIIRGDQSILKWLTVNKPSSSVVGYDDRLRILYYRPVKLTKRLLKTLNMLYESQPRDLKELLLIRGVGPETIRALALVSDLIYKEPPSWNDPVTDPLDPFRYAYAFGGKDGIPYPVKREVMMEAIEFLREAIEKARIGDREKLQALKRLRRLLGEQDRL